MTREELIEKVARSMDPLNSQLFDIFIKKGVDREEALRLLPIDKAEAAIDTVYNVLASPTEEMTFAARHLMLWLGSNRPTEKVLIFWCERRGLPVPYGCENVDHVPPKALQSAWIFDAMLSASPLAPEAEE